MNISPTPTEEEAAAIAAALQMVAFRRVVVAAEARAAQPPAWRFSGRWWARPVAARRDRPWA